MIASKLRVLCLFMAAFGVTNAKDHTFEFGDTSIGQEFYVKEGTIGAFSYNNKFELPKIHDIMLLSGVTVTVSGISKPTVTFKTPTVTIKYKFPQWTYSKYKITVKGLPIYD